MPRLLLLLLAVLTIACASQHTLTGTFTLVDPNRLGFDADGCYGRGGYRDIKGGLEVVVRDGEGSVIGKGRLMDGEVDGAAQMCSFSFEIADIPTSDFYELSVGRRGDSVYTFDEMKSLDWRIDLYLGDNR